MENFITRMEIFIKEISWRIKERDMGKCFGQIRVSIKDSGKKGLKMGKDKFIKQEEILLAEFSKITCWFKLCHLSTKNKWKFQICIFRICSEISLSLKD